MDTYLEADDEVKLAALEVPATSNRSGWKNFSGKRSFMIPPFLIKTLADPQNCEIQRCFLAVRKAIADFISDRTTATGTLDKTEEEELVATLQFFYLTKYLKIPGSHVIPRQSDSIWMGEFEALCKAHDLPASPPEPTTQAATKTTNAAHDFVQHSLESISNKLNASAEKEKGFTGFSKAKQKFILFASSTGAPLLS